MNMLKKMSLLPTPLLLWVRSGSEVMMLPSGTGVEDTGRAMVCVEGSEPKGNTTRRGEMVVVGRYIVADLFLCVS